MADTLIKPTRHRPLLAGSLHNLFFPPKLGEYEYFEYAQEFRYTEGDPIVKAAWAADAAMLSYARYGNRRMNDTELRQNLERGGLELQSLIGEHPDDWNAPGTQAFFATGDGFAVLAFRGTEVDDPKDKMADVDILLVYEHDYHPSGHPAVWHLSTLRHLVALPCLVHRGFHVALNRVWDQVLSQLTEYRQNNPEAEICLTGHSLGGALALLTYSRLADPNVAAHTFGCPRVGDLTFRDRVEANPGKGHFRWVNHNDVVAHVPLKSPLFIHAPETCYRFHENGHLDCDNAGTIAQDFEVLGHAIHGLPADLHHKLTNLNDLPAPPGASDHSPAHYCIRLWNCLT